MEDWKDIIMKTYANSNGLTHTGSQLFYNEAHSVFDELVHKEGYVDSEIEHVLKELHVILGNAGLPEVKLAQDFDFCYKKICMAYVVGKSDVLRDIVDVRENIAACEFLKILMNIYENALDLDRVHQKMFDRRTIDFESWCFINTSSETIAQVVKEIVKQANTRGENITIITSMLLSHTLFHMIDIIKKNCDNPNEVFDSIKEKLPETAQYVLNHIVSVV